MRRVAAAIAALTAALSAAASAQGLSLTPAFEQRVVADDNIYFRPVREADVITRFSPRLDGMYATPRSLVSGGYSFDAERFSRHPQLSTPLSGQHAELRARYDASRRTSIESAGAFTETQTPAELNEVAALAPGRARATRASAQASALYHAAPLNTLHVAYAATVDTLHGGAGQTTYTASAGFEHRASERDGIRLDYVDQRFASDGVRTIVSRAVTMEWRRNLDPATDLLVRGGPRITGSALAPDVAASLTRRLRAGEIGVSYVQTQATLIGLAGVANTGGVSATAAVALRPDVKVRAASGVLRTSQSGQAATVYRMTAACAWTIAPRLTFEAGYDTHVQQGTLYAGRLAQSLLRNVATVTLIIGGAGAAVPR